MLDKLPPELTTNILARLPVDDILRFRSISKSWCVKIDDQSFTDAQLKKSAEINSALTLVFAETRPHHFNYVSLDSPSSIKRFTIPFKESCCSYTDLRIVGSSNGLLCISNVKHATLLNPYTRKQFILPYLIMDSRALSDKTGLSIQSSWSFGFGFDSVNDDYKVLRLGQHIGVFQQFFEADAFIFSLKSKNWRQIRGMPYFHGFSLEFGLVMGLFFGNCLHWLVDKERILPDPKLIVAFDLGVEDFREVPGPEINDGVGDMKPSLNLGVVKEWLSIRAIYGNSRLDCWIMKEYGVKESWTRLFSFNAGEVPSAICPRSLFFSKNGDEVLVALSAEGLVWYNIKQKRVKYRHIPVVDDPSQLEVFNGSLVPLNIEERVDSKKSQRKKGNKDRDEFLSKGFQLVL